MSEVPITRRLNGVDVHDESRGWSLQNDSSVAVGRSLRLAPVSLRGRHGALARGLPTYDSAVERLVWLIQGRPGQGDTDLYAVYDDLVGLLSRPGLVLEHVVGADVRSAPASLESLSEPSDHTAGVHMRVAATLALDGPFLRSSVAEWSVSAGVSSSAVLAGTAPVADAVVRVGAGVVDPSITDTASGTGVSWAGTVPSGQWLYLDALSWRAWLSSSDGAWLGAADPAVTAGMDYPAAGRLQMWPVPVVGGGREVSVDASAAVTVRGARSWL